MSMQETYRYTPDRVIANFTEYMWNDIQVGQFSGRGEYAPGLEPEFVWDGGLISAELAAKLVSNSFGVVFDTRVKMDHNSHGWGRLSDEGLERKRAEALNKMAATINGRLAAKEVAQLEIVYELTPAAREVVILAAFAGDSALTSLDAAA